MFRFFGFILYPLYSKTFANSWNLIPFGILLILNINLFMSGINIPPFTRNILPPFKTNYMILYLILFVNTFMKNSLKILKSWHLKHQLLILFLARLLLLFLENVYVIKLAVFLWDFLSFDNFTIVIILYIFVYFYVLYYELFMNFYIFTIFWVALSIIFCIYLGVQVLWYIS